MIKAYLAGISTHYEGEDIEIRYQIFSNEELVDKKSIFIEYKKPAIVGQIALITLLKELERYIGNEITIFINDPALNEQIRGTTSTKNKDVLKMARLTREELDKFENWVTITDVSTNSKELGKWNEILKP